MNKVAVLGSGNVGQVLANALKNLGYEVTVGNRTGHEVDNWSGLVGKYSDIITQAQLIVLCVKGSAAKDLIESIKDQITDKTIIDTTNPISSEPPVDGVLNFFTSYELSLMEQL